MINLDSLVRDAYDLEPLPATTMRLLAILSDPDWSLDTVVDAAALDAPLTARILSVANSAAYAGSAPVLTLADATMRIGAAAVIRIGTGCAVKEVISSSRSPRDPGEVCRSESVENDLWLHSVATALGTELIAKTARIRLPPETFTAALLHDIGRVVLWRYLDRTTVDHLDRAIREAGQNIIESEREILGVDHAEVGALIGSHWKLPESIVYAIRFHHAPEQASHPETRLIAHAIDVADTAARVIEDCPSEGMTVDCIDSLEQLGIASDSFDEIAQQLEARLDLALADYE